MYFAKINLNAVTFLHFNYRPVTLNIMALQLTIDMSPVKRERLKKLAARKRKLDMRAALPILTKEEIRRFDYTILFK